MRRFLVAVVVVLGLVAGVGSTVASAGSAPACGVRWGSLAKADPAFTTAALTDVRSGRHACFDRLVIDLASSPGVVGTGYDVRYVSRVTEDGSGRPVPLAGGAFLQVIVHAPAYDAAGRPTYAPALRSRVVNVAGFRTFRQVGWAGSFEGRSTIGIGVRARLPFRAFVLAGPGAGSRIVIDVAHRW